MSVVLERLKTEKQLAENGGLPILARSFALAIAEIEAAEMARTRLEAFADDANSGRVHYSARELKRKIWAAFAQFGTHDKQRAAQSAE